MAATGRRTNYQRYGPRYSGRKTCRAHRPQRRRENNAGEADAGLETPTSGQIFLDGKDITPLDVTQRARCGVSYAFQTPVRFKGLTVRDLVELAAGGALSEATLCELLGKVGLCAANIGP